MGKKLKYYLLKNEAMCFVGLVASEGFPQSYQHTKCAQLREYCHGEAPCLLPSMEICFVWCPPPFCSLPIFSDDLLSMGLLF